MENTIKTEIKDKPKPGFKLTKLGWIPEEWEIFLLKNILEEGKLGGNYQNLEFQKGLPLIKMGNIGRGRIQLDKIDKVSENLDYENDHILKKGDLLFNTRNTLDLVGKVAIWRNELPKALYNSNLMRMKFDNEKVYSNYYMNYYFNSYNGLRQLRGFAIGTTSVAAIYTRDLLKIKIPLPPLPEQQKIAQILSTWDKAIEKTEQLIQTKTQLKKGLMQQLLTGKKRFGEFEGDWEEYHLDELVKKSKGSIVITNNERKGVPLIDTSSFNGKVDYYTEEQKAKQCKKNDVLILWDGSKAGRVMTNKEGIVGSTFAILSPIKRINNMFLTYRMKHDEERIMAIREGSGIPHVPKDFLHWYRLKLPNIIEQEKIAHSVSIIDIEIDKLCQILILINEQKKGLMQKLLTGEVRVKID